MRTLAVGILEAAQIEAPVNAWVLARRHGYHLRAVRGPTPRLDAPAVDGKVIMFDVTAYWRDQHGEIARALARLLLLDQGATTASSRAEITLAKELLLPRAAFDRDARRVNFDIEELGALHRYAPIEWIDARARALSR